jgi:hypothetical protein
MAADRIAGPVAANLMLLHLPGIATVAPDERLGEQASIT